MLNATPSRPLLSAAGSPIAATAAVALRTPTPGVSAIRRLATLFRCHSLSRRSISPISSSTLQPRAVRRSYSRKSRDCHERPGRRSAGPDRPQFRPDNSGVVCWREPGRERGFSGTHGTCNPVDLDRLRLFPVRTLRRPPSPVALDGNLAGRHPGRWPSSTIRISRSPAPGPREGPECRQSSKDSRFGQKCPATRARTAAAAPRFRRTDRTRRWRRPSAAARRHRA